MTLKSSISTIKIFDPGTDISYGRTFRTAGKTRIGVLPIGYADGFFRGLSNRMSVVTDAGKAPLRGRICMDMSMVDLTDLPAVKVGDEVEIFGRRQKVDDLAAVLNTIPYELICAVSKRVPRVYLEERQDRGAEPAPVVSAEQRVAAGAASKRFAACGKTLGRPGSAWPTKIKSRGPRRAVRGGA